MNLPFNTMKSLYAKSRLKKRNIIYFVLLLIVNSFFELITISSIYPFLNMLLDESFRLDTLGKISFFEHVEINDQEIIFYSVIAYLMLILTSMGIRLFTLWYQASFSQKLSHNITIYSLNCVLNQNLDFYINNDTSHIQSLFTTKSIQLANEYLLPIFLLLSSLLTLIILMSFFLIQDALLTFKVFFCIYVIYFVSGFATKKRLLLYGKELSVSNSALLKNLNLTLNNTSEIYLKNKQRFFSEKIELIDMRIRKSISAIQFLSNFPRIFVESLFLCVLVVVLYLYLDKSMIQNYLPVLAVIVLSIQRIMPIVQQIYRSIALFHGSKFVIDEFLNIPEPSSVKTNEFDTFQTSLEIQNLSFSFGEDKILQNIDMKIPCNTALGLVGKSGSGKSTLVKVLLGLHDNYSGKILIDGIDVNRFDRSKIFSYVSQDASVIDGTILDNIVFGSAIDVEEVIRCLKSANLADFTAKDKLMMYVGEDGKFLSGGQKQRLMIARALYSSCKILILDEATSALDYKSQNEVISTINSLKSTITILIIAHRQEIIDICDEVFSL